MEALAQVEELAQAVRDERIKEDCIYYRALFLGKRDIHKDYARYRIVSCCASV